MKNQLKASIDIGSNSLLLLVGYLDQNDHSLKNKIINVEEVAQIAGLGRGLDQTKMFSVEAMNDAYAILESYLAIIKKHQINPDEVVVTATEAARVAKNAHTFFNRIKKNLGLTVHIISGEKEAYYSALGVISQTPLTNDSVMLLDIGGASTEIIHAQVKPFKIIKSYSFPIGVVRYTENPQDIDITLKNVIGEFDYFKSPSLIAMAGTMTSLGLIALNHQHFEEAKVDLLKLDREQVKAVKDKVLNSTIEQLNLSFPFLGKRAKTIKAGVVVADYFMQKIQSDHVIISSKGLRHGTLISAQDFFSK